MTAKLPPSDDDKPEKKKQQPKPEAEGPPPDMDLEQANAYFGRDRKGLAGYIALGIGTLAGSYFHRLDDEHEWSGQVVAEIEQGSLPPYYLLEVESGLTEGQMHPVQLPFRIDEMAEMGFRFYDTRERMQDVQSLIDLRKEVQ